MRKVLVVLFIAVATIGSVWGQAIPSDDKTFTGLDQSVFGVLDTFNAVPTLSTEARYSAWLFDADVDNYIDPLFYDPAIGTFFFLGGYPAEAGSTKYLTPGESVPNPAPTSPQQFFSPGRNYAISLGFGKTIVNDMYVAAYYGGSMIDAYGQTTKNPLDPDKYNVYAYAMWRNNLAILFGFSDMGFRFDLIADNTAGDRKTTADGKDITSNLESGANLALTWGISLGKLSPYATIGYKFGDTESYNRNGKKASHSKGAILGFTAGTYYDLNEKSAVSAALLVGAQFAESYSGDEGVLLDEKSRQPHTEGGAFGIGFKADYKYTFEYRKVALGLKPNLKLGLISLSHKNSLAGTPDRPSDNYFTLSTGLDVGFRYKPSDKFAFYTGVGFRFFEWNTHNQPGGSGSYTTKASEWEFVGIEWNEESLAGGNLGFGMTFTPNEYISIGYGLNSILDKIVKLNLQEMTVTAGPIWGNNKGNFGSWLSSIFEAVTLDLTLNIKFPEGGISPRAAK